MVHGSVHLLLTAFISTATASCLDQNSYYVLLYRGYYLLTAHCIHQYDCYNIHQYIYCMLLTSVQVHSERGFRRTLAKPESASVGSGSGLASILALHCQPGEMIIRYVRTFAL